MTRTWRDWVPDVGVGLGVAFFGLFEAATTDFVQPQDSQFLVPGSERLPLVFVALGIAVSVGLSRRLPGIALAMVWAVCGIQVLNGVDLMLVELSIAAVAFGTARWGSTTTVWLSALSIPLAAVVAVMFVWSRGPDALVEQIGNKSLVNNIAQLGYAWQVVAAIAGMAVLGVPWLAGLALRFGARAQASRVSQVAAEEDAARALRESEQAREIAQLREEQARMARDVHDVVGHSLAVILAQAESAQFVEDVDTQALKKTMANIATSARSSLQDVRQVLTTTNDTQPVVRQGDLDSLIEGVRASGHEVASTEVGTPQPLPPELDVVAFRVLQEMLTNAIKHGVRGQPVLVERHWHGELRIEVSNAIDQSSPDDHDTGTQGQGLEGMRRRLESVGGRLDVRRRDEADVPTFTATAWVPLRAVTR